MNNITEMLSPEQQKVLAICREKFGEDQQVVVSMGEFAELVTAISKYPRYMDKDKARSDLHDGVVDEVADTLICLDHVIKVFQLNEEELQQRLAAKVERINRWNSNDSYNRMECTIADREVIESPEEPWEPSLDDPVCQSCAYLRKMKIYRLNPTCVHCGKDHKLYIKAWDCSGCGHMGKVKSLQPGGACLNCVGKRSNYTKRAENEAE